jgi:hypothetical protein
MHWYSDCPKRGNTAQVNYAARANPVTSPNNIALMKNKWRPRPNQEPEAWAKDVNVITTRSKKTGKKGKTSNQEAPRQLPNILPLGVLEVKQSDICPTFALAKFDNRDGMLHKVCIDTGSSISCVDYDYAQQYLSHNTIQPSSNLRLLGEGTNITTGTVKTVLHLVTEDSNDFYEREITFYIVPRLNTKMIIENDQLVPMQARIDLKAERMTFDNVDHRKVIIASSRLTTEKQQQPTARTKEFFRQNAGCQAHIPILVTMPRLGGVYQIEPSQPLKDIYVARSIANVNAEDHFAMICNVGDYAVKIPAGTLVGTHEIINVNSNHSREVNPVLPRTGSSQPQEDDHKALEEEITKLDINSELTEEQKSYSKR